MIVNLYGGRCARCGIYVAAGAGCKERVHEEWQLFCLSCNGQRAREIVFSPADRGSVEIQPRAWMGDELMALYRDALTLGGARYDREAKRNLCSYEALPRVVAALRSAGLFPFRSLELDAILRAREAAVAKAQAAADERAHVIDARLRDRGLSLYPFQRIGSRWLASRTGAVLADDMGLGKTIQALCALPDDAAVLVVCPAIARGVWFRETVRFRPDLMPGVVKGRGAFRWPGKAELLLCTYDLLPDDLGGLPVAPDRLHLIVDEAHAVKGLNSLRTRRMRTLCDAIELRRGRRWLVTATPILNDPKELWVLLSLAGVATEAFGTWSRFKELMGGEAGEYGGVQWDESMISGVAKDHLRRVMIRRSRTEVLPELPTKTYRDIEVEISEREAAMLDQLAGEIDALGFDWELDVPAELTPAAPSRAIAFDKLSRARRILAEGKIAALQSLVSQYEEAREPLIVFSMHRKPVDVIGSRPGWAAITGDTSSQMRSRIEARFQSGELRGIAATIQAGGTAVTLTRACHVLFASQSFTPALNAQAEDRACRIGQSRGVIVTRLVADHQLDRRMAEILARKQATIEASVEASAIGPTASPEEAACQP